MRTQLFWMEGPWPGKLAIMPRPRGDDWLEEEIQAWRRSGVDVLVSLLTDEEQADLGLRAEAEACGANDIEFVSFPIVDRSVPASREDYSKLVSGLAELLAKGKSVAVHCRQGIGRAALIAISLLVLAGMEPQAASERVGVARRCTVPETAPQRQWIADFARSLAAGQAR